MVEVGIDFVAGDCPTEVVQPGDGLVPSLALAEDLGFQQGVELFSSQQLVAELAVEAVDTTVHPRAAWLNEKRLHANIPEPFSDRLRCELRAAVIRDVPWHAAADKQIAGARRSISNRLRGGADLTWADGGDASLSRATPLSIQCVFASESTAPCRLGQQGVRLAAIQGMHQ